MLQERASSWYMKDEFGFDSIPPPEAQVLLLRALMICARGDGELSPPEREWALGFAAVSNLSETDIADLASYPATDSLASIVEAHPLVDETGRRALVYFALRAARSDGELAPGELEAIKSLAEQVDVSEELVEQIVALAEAEHRLKTLRMALLSPGGAPF